MGVLDKIFMELSSLDIPAQLQINATHSKAHRAATRYDRCAYTLLAATKTAAIVSWWVREVLSLDVR